MRIHNLKCNRPFFQAVAMGTKTFEYRLNDRNFAAGDILCLREWDADWAEFGKHQVNVIVTYILDADAAATLGAALPAGWCILGIRRI